MTSSPCIAPNVIRLRMLAAATGWPPSLRMVTVTGCCAANRATSAAGLACRPTSLATRTRTSGTVRPGHPLRRGVHPGPGLLDVERLVLPARCSQVPPGDHEPEHDVVDDPEHQSDRD